MNGQDIDVGSSSKSYGTDPGTDVNQTTSAQQNENIAKAENKVDDENKVTTYPPDNGSTQADQNASNNFHGASSAAPTSEGYANSGLTEQEQRDLADLKKQKEFAEAMDRDNGLYLIDEYFCGLWGYGQSDHKIDWGNIKDAAKHPESPAYKFAKMFMEDQRMFDLIDADHDGLISGDEVRAFEENVKGKIAALEDKAKASSSSASTQSKPPPPPPPGKGTNPPAVTEADINNETPRPEPSKQKGFEGAAENVNNMTGWVESEIDRLSKLMLTADPATQKVIENKMNKLTQMLQRLTNMLNQIMTMESNLSKLQSDIAMNSIRNMR